MDSKAEMPDDLKQALSNYKIPDDLKEVVHRIAQDAEDMDLRLSEFKFIHSSKWFGVAVGGAVFVLGVMFILVSIYMFFNLFELAIGQDTAIMIGSASAVIGALQLLAGVILMGR